MSYSCCISCEQMVPLYEKYCSVCLRKYPYLKQVEDFWKNNPPNWQAARELGQIEKLAKGK